MALSLIFSVSPRALATKPSTPQVSTEAPAGFELLDKARELLVDVVFAETRIGRTTVVVEAGKLRFKEPGSVADLIDGLKDRDAVVAALAVSLETNIGHLCTRRPQDDSRANTCGTLSPERLAIIFDESRLRVLLFINERYLDPLALVPRAFLQRPDAGPSFIGRVDGAFAGATQSPTDVNLRTLTLAAWREGRLRGEASLSSRDGLVPENMTLEVDRPGWLYRAGFFRGFGTRLVGESKAYGISIASSTAARIDLDQAFGSQLAVFLPRPAFVDVLRDGRILSSRYYPAGNRLVDTSDLPEGAYQVTLRIREVDGRTRDELRFFAKSELVPPRDQPLFFFEAAALASRRTHGFAPPSNVPIGRVGTRVRVRDGFALGADFLATPQDAFGEVSAYYIAPFAHLVASAFATPRGDWGGGLTAIVQYREFSAHASARYVRAARAPISFPDDPKTFRFVNGNSLQFLGGIGYYYRGARLGITAQWQESNRVGQRRTFAYGPNAHVPLIRRNGHTVEVIGEFLATNKGYTGFAKIVWRWGLSERAVLTADAGVRAIRSDRSRELREQGRIELTYQPEPILDHDITLQPSVTRDGPLSLGLNSSVMGPLGRARGSLLQTFDGARTSTAFGGNISTGIAIDTKGIGFGGRDPHQSGVIVKLVGPRSAGRYQVLVDRSPKLTLRAGESKPLFLVPYKSYRIAIRPAEGNNTLVALANLERKVVLYPGTAQTLEWSVEPVTVVFGRVVDARAAPVAGASIEGGMSPSETDERGHFQAEVRGAKTLTFTRDGQPPCTITLGTLMPRNGLARIGTVVCGGGTPQARAERARRGR